MDALFSDQDGPGWIGGDASYSTALPNGQEAFTFSDTLIGTAQPNGEASLTGLPHSSQLTGTMSTWQPTSAAPTPPQTLIPDGSGNDSWQPGHIWKGALSRFASMSSSSLRQLVRRLHGPSLGIASFSLSSGQPTFTSVTLIPTDANTQWGNAVTQSGGYD